MRIEEFLMGLQYNMVAVGQPTEAACAHLLFGIRAGFSKAK